VQEIELGDGFGVDGVETRVWDLQRRIWSWDWKGEITKPSTVRLVDGQWSWIVLLMVAMGGWLRVWVGCGEQVLIVESGFERNESTRAWV
jgi:hypothetical protein